MRSEVYVAQSGTTTTDNNKITPSPPDYDPAALIPKRGKSPKADELICQIPSKEGYISEMPGTKVH